MMFITIVVGDADHASQRSWQAYFILMLLVDPVSRCRPNCVTGWEVHMNRIKTPMFDGKLPPWNSYGIGIITH